MGSALEQWAMGHGAWGLFAVAFLAATILPFSSEVAIGGALVAGMPWTEAVVASSLGNCLACVVNYGLGAMLSERTHEKLSKGKVGQRALDWGERHGAWALLASWLPVIGDPLTIVAGLMRVPLPVFLAIVLPLRVLRYLLIAAPFMGS